VVTTQQRALSILIPLKTPKEEEHGLGITISLCDLIERPRAQNQELPTLRDWLLPMLMNGQTRVTG
jgi:hypothetical protein